MCLLLPDVCRQCSRAGGTGQPGESHGVVSRVHFPGEQGGGCQDHSRESAESRSRAEGGKAERTARGCWGGEGRRPVPAPPADLQLQHRHSALVTGEDGWNPPGNSSGPAETEFNVCRREQGQGTSVGISLLQGPETPICRPHLKSQHLLHAGDYNIFI